MHVCRILVYVGMMLMYGCLFFFIPLFVLAKHIANINIWTLEKLKCIGTYEFE